VVESNDDMRGSITIHRIKYNYQRKADPMRFLSPLFILTALWAQESAESHNWLNQGVQAFRNAQYDAAVQAFQRAIDLEPSSLTAHLYLATAFMQQYIPGAESNENSQVAARAKEEFSQVLALDPTNLVALASMASLYLNEKKWDDAQQWYRKLIAVDPSNADAYYSLGFIAWSKWYPAYQAARASAGLKPDDQGPIPDLAVKQDLRRRWGSVVEDGIANFQKTLELRPQYEGAMSYMSLLIRERADLRDTKEEWRQDIVLADQWLQRAQTQKAGGGAGFSPQAGIAPNRIGAGEPVQAATQTANGYSLEGLPQYGITLSGSPENPVIENHSGRVVIGYDMKFADANGRGPGLNEVLAPSVQPAGIPDGGALYAMGAFPVNSTVPRPSAAQVRSAGQGPIVRVTLQSVIFADGQFVGMDEHGAFEQFVKKIKAIAEVGKLAKIQAWDQIEAFANSPLGAPPSGEDHIVYIFHQFAARRLVETRKFKGDAAAGQLTEIYNSLPTLWK
jgi:tetratricopeptide (TPR) repeat protein